MPLKFHTFFLTIFLVGCVSQKAPVSSLEIPAIASVTTHIVQQGETLYSIAWRYDLDVAYLAQINKIGTNSQIRAGQALRILSYSDKNLEKVQPKKDKNVEFQTIVKGKGIDESKDPGAVGDKDILNRGESRPFVEIPDKDSTSLNWQWPVKGKIIDQFDLEKLKKGIRIQGVSRSAVRPMYSGEVVYAGEGFQGYGKLIIVKHTNSLLSAYAQNDQILVAEGQIVKKMQIISKLGHSGVLYFEIRQNGKPADPISFLK
jgi:lipoprotein NlpD